MMLEAHQQPEKVAAKTAKKRTPTQRMNDLCEVSRMTLIGYSHREIALKLNEMRPYKLSRTQIAYDLEEIKALWREDFTQKIDEFKQQRLAALKMLWRETWEQWQRSKEDVIRQQQRKKDRLSPVKSEGGDAVLVPDSTEANVIRYGKTGDPRYLIVLMQIEERIAKLLGLDAPQQFEHGGPDGQPIPIAGQFTNTPIDVDRARAIYRDVIRQELIEEFRLHPNGQPDGNGAVQGNEQAEVAGV